jgi:hypothetical protein
MGPSVRRLNNAVDTLSLFAICQRVVLCYTRLQRLNRREKSAVLTPPVQSAPCRVVQSRARRFSQTHPHASRQSQQLVADFSSSAKGTPGTSTLEEWELAATDGDQSLERIQEMEERK